MPFGLTNAPAVFQALVNDVLRDMLNRFIFVYLDDILIFSQSMEEHVQHVSLVLQLLLENKLFVKAENVSFTLCLSFLGFIVCFIFFINMYTRTTKALTWYIGVGIKHVCIHPWI